MFLYTVRNRVELSVIQFNRHITEDYDDLVKYYSGNPSDSIEVKWEWFQKLPTVKEFLGKHLN